MQQFRAHRDEEQHFGGDTVFRAPGEPVLGVHTDLQMHEARGQWRRHAVDDAAIALAVAAGDQRGALGQFVFAHPAVEHQLVERGLHHRHGRGQFLQIDEPAAGIVTGRQEGRRCPAGAVRAVPPGNAAQVHGIEQQGAHIDIAAPGLRGDLLGERALGTTRGAPQHHRLSGFDQQRQRCGQLARAERVVGGDRQGIGHRQAPGWRAARALPPDRPILTNAPPALPSSRRKAGGR